MTNKTKVAVVTACFLMDNTKIDECSKNFEANKEWDYFLFTNDKSKIDCSKIWKIREIDCSKFTNGVYAAKHVKWKTHNYLPDYDVIIWVDSFIVPNMKKIKEINEMIECVKNTKNLILIPKHTFKSIHDNIKWCVDNKRISKPMANKIIEHLTKKEKLSVYDERETYWSLGLIKNNKSKNIQSMSNELFDLIETVGYRDQFWLAAMFKKHNVIPKTIKNDSEKIFIEAGKHCPQNHNYTDFMKK
uniref:Glycosyltransferase n=1 Tax=viral metagenome TaxID=1070528 RepID=A0A6C0BBB8_9ZZZZ